MKKINTILVCILVMMLIAGAFSSCGSSAPEKEETTTKSYSASASPNGNTANKGSDEVKDWMVDQAQGKDYGHDDGGSYYCMGKNDTCTNKTKNAYDLYCNSCDPDGDNVEG